PNTGKIKIPSCADKGFPFSVSPAMKRLLSLALLSMLSMAAVADIQDPPANDYGPTRKLGRGIANIAFGVTELSVRPNMINESEGNSAAWSYGIVQGVGRFFARLGYGVYETVTFPLPTTWASYRTPYK